VAERTLQNGQTGERIAKVIARAGLASRREAEQWIAAGRVAVNGAVIRSAALNVTARDQITVDGAPLPTRERTRLFLYHKPRGLMTTHADPQGRPTIFEELPKDLPRMISVGRLDFNTEGLLLLTNDGALARVLELPSTGWLRRYRVRAHGSAAQAQLDALHDGVTIDGTHYGAIEATLDRVQGSNLWLTFAIREGKHREVRNVLGHLGLKVTRLIRVSFGPFQLGDLVRGEIEEVRTRVLREQLGARVIALAGADFSAPARTDRGREAAPAEKSSLSDGTRRERSRALEPRQHERPRHGPTSHSWRAPADARPPKLRRKFHGTRRDDGDETRQQPATEPRKSLLTDRKGREIAVERYGASPDTKHDTERKERRRGRRRAFDRAQRKRSARKRHR
jgi:23S rRNA pseudouridine2605 synthase